MIIDSSYIYIVNDIDEMLEIVSSSLSKHNTRIIRNIEKDDFLLQQANLVIKEAYIASNERKTIILCGNTFRKEAQNALLKILEEPPRNIVFIILTTSKSSLLPTILSRMPHKFLKKSIKRQKCDLDVLNLDLKTLYSFLKKEEEYTSSMSLKELSQKDKNHLLSMLSLMRKNIEEEWLELKKGKRRNY